MNPVLVFNIGSNIIKYYRNNNGKLIRKLDSSFLPYFYVEDERGKFVAIDGKKAKRIGKKNPKDVPNARTKYESKGKKTYEADVIYTIRYCIDNYPAMPEGQIWQSTPIRYAFIDVEARDSLDYKNAPEPIVCLTLYDNFLNMYVTLVQGERNRIVNYDGWTIIECKDEKELLGNTLKLIYNIDPDLILAWNIKYDINYLVNRCEKLRLNVNTLARDNGQVVVIDKEVKKIFGRAIIDYKILFEHLYKLDSYALENVAEKLGLSVKKIKRKKISEMNISELINYNKRDVEILVEIEKRFKVLKFWDELRRIIGIGWNDLCNIDIGISTKRIIDVYLLRLARKKGIVLPTANENGEKITYKGAYVLEPPAGVFQNVVVFDVKSMYPNIVRTYNISYETLSENGDILSPLGYKFVREPRGLLPQFADQLFELRKYYKKKMKETNDPVEKQIYDLRQQAIKIILNAGYGVFGYNKFRLFKKEVAESITAYGRELLRFLVDRVEKSGLKVLYGDTDSIFVKFNGSLNKQEVLNQAQELLNNLNESLDEFALRWNVDKHYHELEMKMIFDRIAFFGVKKRYAGHYVWNEEEWEEGIEKKGLEVVRSDAANITKIALNKVLEMILVEGKSVKEALNFIDELKQKIVKGQVPLEDLVYKVNYDPNKEYKNVNVPHLRGLRYAKKLGLIDGVIGEKLAWIYISGKNDVIAVPESKVEMLKQFPIDYNKNFKRWFENIEELLNKLVKQVSLFEF